MIDPRALPPTPPAFVVRAATRIVGMLAALRRRVMPAQSAAIELATSSWPAIAVRAFCLLRLPDALNERARTPLDLAQSGYGNAESLARLLRALSGYGIVRARRDGSYELARIGKTLVSGPSSAAGMFVYANEPWHLQAFARLADGVAQGRPAFEIANGAPLFDYCAANPDAGASFDAGMNAVVAMHAGAVLQAYDFHSIRRLVDVGGGNGFLLAAIAARNPSLQGTVFDLPAVADRARALLERYGLSDRCIVTSGNFFEDDPPPANAYLLSHILHDWDDASCTRILQNVRRAMPPDARVLIVDIVASPPRNRWLQEHVTDLEMLAMLPGRERTHAEFETLLAAAGLRLRRVIPMAAAESIVEATAAD